jgi:hypothetical protein
MRADWQIVGNIGAPELERSRVQLHSAAQLVAAVGKALAHPEPDDSHTSLEWNSERNSFAGVKVSYPALQAWLEVLTLTFVVAGSDGAKRLELNGHTLGEAFQWLRTTLQEQGGEAARLNNVGDRSQLPDGVFGAADKFNAVDRAGFAEWSRQYGNADLLLREVKAMEPGFSAIRVWPHHFDIATLGTLSQGKDAQKTIGAGLSPGDSSYNEPYWYVTPWPYPDAKNLAPLDGAGTWHTQGWVGAVLPTSRIVRENSAEQQTQVRKFLQSAIRICGDLLQKTAADQNQNSP